MNGTTMKRVGLVFSLFCGVGLFACLLCDLLISGTITWAALTSLSIIFGWLVGMIVVYSGKHVIRNGLTAVSVLILPFLFLLDIVNGGQGWFWPLALPIGVASVVSLWLSLYLFQKVRRLWAVLAIAALQYGVVLDLLIQWVVSRYEKTLFFTLSYGINLFTSVLLTIVFVVLDIRKRRNQRPEND